MIMETVSSADKMISAEVGTAIVSAWPFHQDDKLVFEGDADPGFLAPHQLATAAAARA